MSHEMPEVEQGPDIAELSRTALFEAKKELDRENINPANIGILGHNLSAELGKMLVAAEEEKGVMFAQQLARYFKDDLENNFRDLFPEEVAEIALRYLDEYKK